MTHSFDPDSRPASAALDELSVGAKAVCGALHQAGFAVYLVGGGVRDFFLGQQVNDVDLATSARPQQVMALFAKTIPTGLKHGTVTVLSADGEPIEITTLRRESGYDDGRHPNQVEFVDAIDQDLGRRDFTINAMALRWPDAALMDPYAGRVDLQQGVLRAVGNASQRFSEDSLRLLRGLRFVAQLDLQVEAETLAAMSDLAATLPRVAPERQRQELLRLLVGPAAVRALQLAHETGILAALWPAFAADQALHQARVGALTTPFAAALSTLPLLATASPWLRLLSLLWTLGAAPQAEQKSDASPHDDVKQLFPGLHVAGRARALQGAEPWLEHLRLSRAELSGLKVLLTAPGWLALEDETGGDGPVDLPLSFDRAEPVSDGGLRRFIAAMGDLQASLLLVDLHRVQIQVAQGLGIAGTESVLTALDDLAENLRRVHALAPLLRVQDLAVDGKTLIQALSLRPGPALGGLLNALLRVVQDDPEQNQEAKLLALARRLLDSLKPAI